MHAAIAVPAIRNKGIAPALPCSQHLHPWTRPPAGADSRLVSACTVREWKTCPWMASGCKTYRQVTAPCAGLNLTRDKCICSNTLQSDSSSSLPSWLRRWQARSQDGKKQAQKKKLIPAPISAIPLGKATVTGASLGCCKALMAPHNAPAGDKLHEPGDFRINNITLNYIQSKGQTPTASGG